MKFFEKLNLFLVELNLGDIDFKIKETVLAQYLARIIHLLDMPTFLIMQLKNKTKNELNSREINAIYYSSLLTIRPAIVASIEAIYIIIKQSKESNNDKKLPYKIFYSNLFHFRKNIIELSKYNVTDKIVIDKHLKSLQNEYDFLLEELNIDRQKFLNIECKNLIPDIPTTSKMFEYINTNNNFKTHSNLGSCFYLLSKLEHYGEITNKIFVEELNFKKLISESYYAALKALSEIIYCLYKNFNSDSIFLYSKGCELEAILNEYEPENIGKELNQVYYLNKLV